MTPAPPPMTTAEARALMAAVLHHLGETPDEAELSHVLPSFRPTVTTAEFRNALTAFGVLTVPQNAQPLSQTRAAALLVAPNNGGPPTLVKLSRDGRPRVWRDGAFAETAPDDYRVVQGRSFTFKKEETTQPAPPHEWFFDILGRFHRYVPGLLMTSFAVNLFAVATPVLIMVIYDRIIGEKSTGALPMFALAVMILAATDLMFRVAKVRLLARMGARLDHIIGVNVIAKLMRLPSARLESAPVSAQVQRVRDFEAIREVFTGPVASAVTEMPFAILIVIALAAIAGPLVFIPLAGGVILIGLNWISGRISRNLDRRAVQRQNAYRAFVVEAAALRTAIDRCRVSEEWLHRFRSRSAQAAAALAEQSAHTARIEALSSGVMNAAALATAALGALMVLTQSLTVGGLIATMALVWKLLSPLQITAVAASRVVRLRRAVTQMNRFFALPEERLPKPSAFTQQRRADSIVFERVSFRYAQVRDPALLGMSFAVRPHEFFAIAGPTGSGKSTIAKLIMRMHEPGGGAIRLGETDIRQFSHQELRRSVGYVPQVDHLFHGTVRDNVLFGDPTREADMLEWAVEMSGLNRAFAATGLSLDTMIGGLDGVTAPDKVARSISFARALIRNPAILLVDEPEKGLDTDAAAAFLDLLAMERGERTIVIISHRPSFLSKAQRGVFIANGAVQAEGSGAEIATYVQRPLGAAA